MAFLLKMAMLHLSAVTALTCNMTSGRIQGGGGIGSHNPHPLGTPTLHKAGKTLHACLGIYPVLVLNSYPYPRLSEILHPQMLNVPRNVLVSIDF